MTGSVPESIRDKFIHRLDVKAKQGKNGAYYPVRNQQDENIPWQDGDVEDHISGRVSLGHYLVGNDGNAKLFAFDIDLEKPNPAKEEAYYWRGIEADGTWTDMEPREFHPREAWHHPKAPDNLKRFVVSEMRTAADRLADSIRELIPELPMAVAYSGNKGLHVYGLSGEYSAADLRGIGMEILDAAGFAATRGDNFYKAEDVPTVSVELFPKQGTLEGKDLGNLMRLPLGVNHKSGKPAHFVTLSAAIDELVELDAEVALEGNPWAT